MCIHAVALDFFVLSGWFKFKRGFKIQFKICFGKKEKKKGIAHPPSLLSACVAQQPLAPACSSSVSLSRTRPLALRPSGPSRRRPSSRASTRVSPLLPAAHWWAGPIPCFTDRWTQHVSDLRHLLPQAGTNRSFSKSPTPVFASQYRLSLFLSAFGLYKSHAESNRTHLVLFAVAVVLESSVTASRNPSRRHLETHIALGLSSPSISP
jgi:hypothetical protein